MPLEWSDDIEDHEYPEPDEDDEGIDTVACVQCGEHFYDEAPSCPYCGHYQSAQARTMPMWWIVVIVLMIVSFLFFVF